MGKCSMRIPGFRGDASPRLHSARRPVLFARFDRSAPLPAAIPGIIEMIGFVLHDSSKIDVCMMRLLT